KAAYGDGDKGSILMTAPPATTRSDDDLWIEHRKRVSLTPGTINLNSGTLSPTPLAVLEAVTRLRQRLAANPSDFLWRKTPPLINAARARLAQYVRCDPADLLLLPNITFAINIIAESLKLPEGTEILTTDHEYGAMMACWRRAAKRQKCSIRQITLPYLAEDPREIV